MRIPPVALLLSLLPVAATASTPPRLCSTPRATMRSVHRTRWWRPTSTAMESDVAFAISISRVSASSSAAGV